MKDAEILNLLSVTPEDIVPEVSPEDNYKEALKIYKSLWKEEYGQEPEVLSSDPVDRVLRTIGVLESAGQKTVNDQFRKLWVSTSSGDYLRNLVSYNGTQSREGETDQDLLIRYFNEYERDFTAGSSVALRTLARKVEPGVADLRPVADKNVIRCLLLFEPDFYPAPGDSEQVTDEKFLRRSEGREKIIRELRKENNRFILSMPEVFEAEIKEKEIKIQVKVSPGADEGEVVSAMKKKAMAYLKTIYRVGAVYRDRLFWGEIYHPQVTDAKIISSFTDGESYPEGALFCRDPQINAVGEFAE